MTDNNNHADDQPLESWKEIAAYLKRDVRTVIRWEKSEGLPVHRQMHQARGSVFAYPSELEAWKGSRELRLDTPPVLTPWRRAVSAVGFALVLLLALGTLSSGPILTPTRAAAQQFKGIVNRQVWGGPDVDILGSVSSDGRYLSYTDWETGDLAIRDLETGKNRRLTDKGPWESSGEYAESSTPSPDGKQVAYAWWNKDDLYDLRVVGLDGSKPRVLYVSKDGEWVQPATWSPDGKQILTILTKNDATNQMALVSVADGAVHVLKTLDSRAPQKASISPDGRYIVYDLPPKEGISNRDIFLLEIDGKRESPLVEHPANDVYPIWTPDGKHILFVSDRTGSMGLWITSVAEGKPLGSPELIKQDVGKQIESMGFTRDGRFYYGLHVGMMDVQIASLDTKTGKLLAQPKRATESFIGSNRSPDWSPDGRQLVYVSHRGPMPFGMGSYLLCIRSLESDEERDLVPKLNYLWSPRWSPDGRSILLLANDVKNHQGIYLMDVESGNVTPLMQLQDVYMNGIVWSRDGEAIYYRRLDYSSHTPSIVVRDLKTGQERMIVRADPGGSPASFDVSPDGRWVVFRSLDRATGVGTLNVISTSGGRIRELVRAEKGESLPGYPTLAWTPDGSQVLFTRNSRSSQEPKYEVWRVPAEGGEPQKTDLVIAGAGLRDLRIHPDGQRIAYTAGEPMKSEVWVMENFLPALKAAK
jgi:Tol biopolymer transport system component